MEWGWAGVDVAMLWRLHLQLALLSAGILFKSAARSGLQLRGGRPGVRVCSEHVCKQCARGWSGRGGQRGRPLKPHGDAQLELRVLPQSFPQRHHPA